MADVPVSVGFATRPLPLSFRCHARAQPTFNFLTSDNLTSRYLTARCGDRRVKEESRYPPDSRFRDTADAADRGRKMLGLIRRAVNGAP
jgi:hypothetical protein